MLWLNTYAAAVQAFVAVTSVILVIVTICVANRANKTAIDNQKLLRIHSSPKPFLSIRAIFPNPENTSENGHRTTLDLDHVVLKNIGPGLAVKVKVYVFASVRHKMYGQNVIPPHGGDAIYCFEDGIPISVPNSFKIELEYESDSGYQRSTVWKVSIFYGEVSYDLESSD